MESNPQTTWDAVDEYLSDQFQLSDSALEAAVTASQQAELPTIQISAAQGRLLQILARSINAKKILELGTLGGYSTIWLARALSADGRLVTLELDPKHAAVAQTNLERAGLADRVDIRVGAAIEILPQLSKEQAGPFDLIFIDADKNNYPNYLPWVLKLARPGTLIIADNIVRGGAVTDPHSEDENVQGVRKFNELISAEPGVLTTVMQTVGVKGYDGFAISLVLPDPRNP